MIIEKQQPLIADERPQAVQDAIAKDVRQVMAAISVMLSGASGTDDDFGQLADLMIVAGAPLNDNGLSWLGDVAALNDRHVLHASQQADSDLPTIALAVVEDDAICIFQNCFLKVDKPGGRMTIVPDSLKDGGFRLGRNGRLKRCGSPKSMDAALPAFKRAYRRFEKLRCSLDTSNVAPMPVRVAS